MISVARAAEPEAAPFGGSTPPVASQRGPVTVDQAPGVDLPPQIAADVRAAIEDALAGREPPGVPIDITLEAGSVVVRVGSLWRRIAIARWDYARVGVAGYRVTAQQPYREITPLVGPFIAARVPIASRVRGLGVVLEAGLRT
jgi:hypothetical protein